MAHNSRAVPFVLTLLLAAPVLAGELHTVQRVIDGDTVVMASGERVRLIGVNAPERRKPLGPMATQCLKDILGGQRIRLEVGVEPVGQD